MLDKVIGRVEEVEEKLARALEDGGVIMAECGWVEFADEGLAKLAPAASVRHEGEVPTEADAEVV